MNNLYDDIGINYSEKRQSDPRIAKQIHQKLKGSQRILNIGAGAGSYEPTDMDLVAVEPSIAMINQRPKLAHPVVQASAEALPFSNKSFSHALTILSMHHWTNRDNAFKEINRVTTDHFIAVSWNPEAAPFWLTRDYFPEIIKMDRQIFPKVSELESYFEKVSVEPLLIPDNCMDGFLAAYWKRPGAYLEQSVRNSISSFAKLENPDPGLAILKSDLDNGIWESKNVTILEQSSIDAGYVIISAHIKNS